MCVGIMAVLHYFLKSSSTSLNLVNALKKLQTTAKNDILVESLQSEICLHIELKHGEGIVVCVYFLFWLVYMTCSMYLLHDYA